MHCCVPLEVAWTFLETRVWVNKRDSRAPSPRSRNDQTYYKGKTKKKKEIHYLLYRVKPSPQLFPKVSYWISVKFVRHIFCVYPNSFWKLLVKYCDTDCMRNFVLLTSFFCLTYNTTAAHLPYFITVFAVLVIGDYFWFLVTDNLQPSKRNNYIVYSYW